VDQGGKLLNFGMRPPTMNGRVEEEALPRPECGLLIT
jgi:hypothetical protein